MERIPGVVLKLKRFRALLLPAVSTDGLSMERIFEVVLKLKRSRALLLPSMNPLLIQNKKHPAKGCHLFCFNGAEEEIRTLDPFLGKEMLYH